MILRLLVSTAMKALFLLAFAELLRANYALFSCFVLMSAAAEALEKELSCHGQRSEKN